MNNKNTENTGRENWQRYPENKPKTFGKSYLVVRVEPDGRRYQDVLPWEVTGWSNWRVTHFKECPQLPDE